MSDQDKLHQQLGDIGLRYLKRTLGEITVLSEKLQSLRGGEVTALKEIEHLSHKIHGSGAMFGFDELSRHARDIEVAAGAGAPEATQLHDQLERHITDLAAAAQSAAQERNVQQ
jgi:HPt (histidine-containing phosphotransfer) domain-containing protein